jgi:hypothetical protein
MKRLLLTTTLLAASIGCVNVQPVGPMVKVFGDKPILALPSKSTKKPGEADAPLPPAPPPTPPAELIFPENVKPENPQDAAKKLQHEFETDRKTMPTPSRTAEISIYKNGEKVQ